MHYYVYRITNKTINKHYYGYNSLISKNIDQQLKGDKISQTKKQNDSGNNNSTSKNISIYNEDNVLMFESHGNFKEFCKEHNLPYIRCCRSYQRNRPMTKEFKGWQVKLK